MDSHFEPGRFGLEPREEAGDRGVVAERVYGVKVLREFALGERSVNELVARTAEHREPFGHFGFIEFSPRARLAMPHARDQVMARHLNAFPPA
jgi:hypothetical protein